MHNCEICINILCFAFDKNHLYFSFVACNSCSSPCAHVGIEKMIKAVSGEEETCVHGYMCVDVRGCVLRACLCVISNALLIA